MDKNQLMQNVKKNQCTAKSKRSGVRCRNSAIKGAKTCRMHNGHSTKRHRGVANSNYRHGKYVKGEPTTTLQQQYIKALNNPNLLSVMDEVAIIDAQLVSIVDGLNENASWNSLIDLWSQFKVAVSNQEAGKQRQAIADIDSLVEGAEKNIRGLHEFNHVADSKRRMVESELKNMLSKGLLVSIEQLQALQSMQLSALKEALDAHADKNTAVNVLRAYSVIAQDMAVQQLPN